MSALMRIGLMAVIILTVGTWGITVEAGILHSWWRAVPVMGAGTALALTVTLCVTGVVISAARAVLMDD